MSAHRESFLAACVQMRAGADKRANLALAAALVDEAARRGARLVVLPENFSWRGRGEDDATAWEPLDGPTVALLATLGRPEAQEALAAEAERSDLAPPLRAAALAAFSTNVERHGVLLTCGHVRAVATRYTLASEASPGTSVAGDILQVLATADRKHRAVRPDAPHTRPTR